MVGAKTKRTPIKRAVRRQITPEITEIYSQMTSPETACTCVDPKAWIHDEECDGCKKWKSLHNQLLDQLQLKPWQYPAVRRRGGPAAWSTPGAVELWRELEAALAEAGISPAHGQPHG